MSREEARHIERQETKARVVQEEDHHCILCDVVIEHAEHDVFFATGRCRYCHEALEGDA